jgi:hypothetical protein
MPWRKTKHFSSTMPREDFLDWLRYAGIEAGMPQLYLDCVDDLRALTDAETEIAELRDEIEECEMWKGRADDVRASRRRFKRTGKP